MIWLIMLIDRWLHRRQPADLTPEQRRLYLAVTRTK